MPNNKASSGEQPNTTSKQHPSAATTCCAHQARNRQQKPADAASSKQEAQLMDEDLRQVHFWSHKQTGVKSKPIKLIKHPIENIARKILISYFIGCLFRLLALLTGPLIVLCAYLLIVPSYLVKRLGWFLTNLLLDTRVKTRPEDEETLLALQSAKLEKQVQWKYQQLNYMEAYWFNSRLVNNIVLQIDNEANQFSLERLKLLVRENVLAKAANRKFLSRVVSRGFPGYKRLYWNYLGLSAQVLAASEPITEPELSCSRSVNSLVTSVDECSVSSTSSKVIPSQTANLFLPIDRLESSERIQLDAHIYLDQSLANSREVNLKTIRRHLHKLATCQQLNMARPLWELRVICTSDKRQVYLIFRCHQSLADGQSLSRLLSSELAAVVVDPTSSLIPFIDDARNGSREQLEQSQLSEADKDELLRPLREKKSFVGKTSKSSSWRSAVIVGPLTILLWVIWAFTRRKHNHLKRCNSLNSSKWSEKSLERRFHMTNYDLTKFNQIKQMTQSTVSDVILCALSGALRDYLRKFNLVSNPPNLNVSLLVDMRQSAASNKTSSSRSSNCSSYDKVANNNNSELAKAEVNCTLVNIPLPTSIEGTVPRLWELRNTMDELRNSVDPWVMLGLQRFLFALLPISWYRQVINCILLSNSSIQVSNLRGPQNVVECWCLDLFHRFNVEAEQGARMYEYRSDSEQELNASQLLEKSQRFEQVRRLKAINRKSTRLKLLHNLGSIKSIYYCHQPASFDIPISFNCISYHNKMFVTCLSQSLLVEDSKLLLELFFGQLNKLANTIAKRRSFVTIVRAPTPIEITCELPSPVSATVASVQDVEVSSLGPLESPISASDEVHSRLAPKSTQMFGFHRDDIETGIRANKCQSCNQSNCVCRRRKSMFSMDSSKQRVANLLNLLQPNSQSLSRRVSRNSSSQIDSVECLCGQQLLRELDEDADRAEDKSSAHSDDNKSDQSASQAFSCPKCRNISGKSSLSLASDEANNGNLVGQSCFSNMYKARSAQLILPDACLRSSGHSKSENDIPGRQLMKREEQDEQKSDGKADTWRMVGRLSARKLSLFPKSVGIGPRIPSPKSAGLSTTRTLIDSPAELISKHFRRSARRSSIATTGDSRTQRVITIKDEVSFDM